MRKPSVARDPGLRRANGETLCGPEAPEADREADGSRRDSLLRVSQGESPNASGVNLTERTISIRRS